MANIELFIVAVFGGGALLNKYETMIFTLSAQYSRSILSPMHTQTLSHTSTQANRQTHTHTHKYKGKQHRFLNESFTGKTFLLTS